MKNILTFLVCLTPFWCLSQVEYTYQTFKDTRVVNGHSVECSEGGELKMIISHRFGAINGGAYEFFGLDQGTMRIGFDYGVTNNLTVGVGRSSFEKTFDGFAKYKLLFQKSGSKSFPVSVTAFSSVAINSLHKDIILGALGLPSDIKWYGTHRLNYNFELIIARKMNDRLSLQVMPSVVHRNLISDTQIEDHDVFAIGGAFKYQLTKQVAVQSEYYYALPGQLKSDKTNSLAVGIDIETKGHVFQLHLSNSKGMVEKFFITETTGKWSAGDIFFGFNITRDWRLTGRR